MSICKLPGFNLSLFPILAINIASGWGWTVTFGFLFWNWQIDI